MLVARRREENWSALERLNDSRVVLCTALRTTQLMFKELLTDVT